jgi:CrcB protein
MNEWLSPVFLLLFFVSAACGGICRAWVSNNIASRFGVQFPYGTLLVNISGALLLGGLAAQLTVPINAAHSSWWLWLGIGFLGSYTTVSSFSLQTLSLMQNHQFKAAFINILLSLGLCLLAVTMGYLLGGLFR